MVWDGAQQFGFLTDPVGGAETGSLQATRAGHSWSRGLNGLSSPRDRPHAILVRGDDDVFEK